MDNTNQKENTYHLLIWEISLAEGSVPKEQIQTLMGLQSIL